jgi:hypothetical protein
LRFLPFFYQAWVALPNQLINELVASREASFKRLAVSKFQGNLIGIHTAAAQREDQ